MPISSRTSLGSVIRNVRPSDTGDPRPWPGFQAAYKARRKRGASSVGAMRERAAWKACVDRALVLAVVPDDCADLSWMSDAERAQPHEVWGCILAQVVPGTSEVRAVEHPNAHTSVWSVVDPDREYLNDIFIELAAELLACEEIDAQADADAQRFMAL